MNIKRIENDTKKLMNLPEDIYMIIESYMPIKNNFAINAIYEYYDYISYKQQIYEEFIWENYVKPNCRCNNFPNNGIEKIYKRRDCNDCFMVENSQKNIIDEFKVCINENKQFNKIRNEYFQLNKLN